MAKKKAPAKKSCPNCGGPEGYPSGHAVGCPIGAKERRQAPAKNNVYVVLDPANHDAVYSELAGVELWTSAEEIENGTFDIEETATRVSLAKLVERHESIRRALLVMVLTDATRTWLATNDPQALQQAEKAVQDEPEFVQFKENHPDKLSPKRDFDQQTIERAGRLLLGWSGLHPRREKEIGQFLEAVDKSTAPEACQDVAFSITGE